MRLRQSKMISVTATTGPALAICPYCKKVVGETIVVMSMPFYAQLGDGLPATPEMLSILFKPTEYCTCTERETE